jgi:hypothetical protein
MLWRAKPCVQFSRFSSSKGSDLENLFGDVGMLPLSLTMHPSKLVRKKRIHQAPVEEWISGKETNFLEGTRGMGCPRTGGEMYQSVAQIFSNIKHNFNIEFPN